MIREVLRAIRDGGLLSRGGIADRVGVQESTLESILSMLSSKGYLKTVESTMNLSRGCIGCFISGQCTQKTSTGKVYVVTEKGKTLLENFKPASHNSCLERPIKLLFPSSAGP